MISPYQFRTPRHSIIPAGYETRAQKRKQQKEVDEEIELNPRSPKAPAIVVSTTFPLSPCETISIKTLSQVSSPIVPFTLRRVKPVLIIPSTWSQLLDQLAQLSRPAFARTHERINGLKSLMSHEENHEEGNSTEWWELPIQIENKDSSKPAKSFVLLFFEGYYDSNIYNRSVLEPETLEGTVTYYYFKLFDAQDANREKPVAMIRASKDMQRGEIIHLEAIPGLMTGNDFKERVCYPLCDFFQLSILEVNDDSKVSLAISPTEVKHLHLRKVRPIFEEDSLTWYGKDGFVPKKLHHVLSIANETYSQDPQFFYAAVQKVKQTSLSFCFYDLLKRYPSEQNQLHALYNKYLNPASLLKRPDFQAHTIHDLGKAIFKAYRQNSTYLTAQELYFFYRNILKFYVVKGKISQAKKMYFLALDVIRRTQVFEKLLDSSPKIESNLSFDQLAAPYLERGAKWWDDLVALQQSDQAQFKT